MCYGAHGLSWFASRIVLVAEAGSAPGCLAVAGHTVKCGGDEDPTRGSRIRTADGLRIDRLHLFAPDNTPAANTQKLNWRTSIVDLLKLLGLDSSFGARKELATEPGCPAELMGDSAKMNMWLHKAVLARIADNGGNVPKDLLD